MPKQEGEHDWEANISSSLGHVRMAAERLSEGDTMRRSKLSETQGVAD